MNRCFGTPSRHQPISYARRLLISSWVQKIEAIYLRVRPLQLAHRPWLILRPLLLALRPLWLVLRLLWLVFTPFGCSSDPSSSSWVSDPRAGYIEFPHHCLLWGLSAFIYKALPAFSATLSFLQGKLN